MFHHTEDAKRLLRELKLLKHLGSHTNTVRMADIFHGWAESDEQLNTYIIGSSSFHFNSRARVPCWRCRTPLYWGKTHFARRPPESRRIKAM